MDNGADVGYSEGNMDTAFLYFGGCSAVCAPMHMK